MQVTKSLLGFASLMFVAVDAIYNKVVSPGMNQVIQIGGGDFTIVWSNKSADETVNIFLMKGSEGNLIPYHEIAANAPNTGSYIWSITNDIPKGSEYAVGIQSSQGWSTSRYITLQLCSTCTSEGSFTPLDPTTSISVSTQYMGTPRTADPKPTQTQSEESTKSQTDSATSTETSSQDDKSSKQKESASKSKASLSKKTKEPAPTDSKNGTTPKPEPKKGSGAGKLEVGTFSCLVALVFMFNFLM